MRGREKALINENVVLPNCTEEIPLNLFTIDVKQPKIAVLEVKARFFFYWGKYDICFPVKV